MKFQSTVGKISHVTLLHAFFTVQSWISSCFLGCQLFFILLSLYHLLYPDCCQVLFIWSIFHLSLHSFTHSLKPLPCTWKGLISGYHGHYWLYHSLPQAKCRCIIFYLDHWACPLGVSEKEPLNTGLACYSAECQRRLTTGVATHSSVLAWRIPGTGEPGGLPSMGSHRVGHDWVTQQQRQCRVY